MPEEMVFLSFTSIVAVTFLAFGLMRTINKHLDRKHGVGPDSKALRSELDDMRAQLQGMDDLRDHIADLEERIDFTERVLAQQRDKERLPKGGM